MTASPGATSEPEQQQKRDQQREDAERLGDGKSENQIAKLALRGRRVAQGGGQIAAENNAHAGAGAAHADAGNPGPDVFRGGPLHVKAPSSRLERPRVNGPDVSHR